MEYFIIVIKKCIDVSSQYDVEYLSVMHQWWNGRHVRLRGVWRDPCKFKSCLVHDSLANANVIKLSKNKNLEFYLATGKALFLMKYFFSYE